MISTKKYDDSLRGLGADYFVNELDYVPDLLEWAEKNHQDLGEPHHPMKLVVKTDDTLAMKVQSEISDEMLSDVIKNLSIRWSVRDNVTDIDKKLDNIKKRLAYCFLKEYARALKKIDGGEIVEDEWVFDEMEYLGFFSESEK